MLKSINLLTYFSEGSVIDIASTDCKITTDIGNVWEVDALKANTGFKGSGISGPVMLSMGEGYRAKLLQEGSKEISQAYIFLKS